MTMEHTRDRLGRRLEQTIDVSHVSERYGEQYEGATSAGLGQIGLAQARTGPGYVFCTIVASRFLAGMAAANGHASIRRQGDLSALQTADPMGTHTAKSEDGEHRQKAGVLMWNVHYLAAKLLWEAALRTRLLARGNVAACQNSDWRNLGRATERRAGTCRAQRARARPCAGCSPGVRGRRRFGGKFGGGTEASAAYAATGHIYTDSLPVSPRVPTSSPWAIDTACFAPSLPFTMSATGLPVLPALDNTVCISLSVLLSL